MTNTLKDIPKDKLYEFPVAEEMQLGISNGLALNNCVPVSIFPRWNFLLLATNQLVNHLDKFHVMSQGKFKTKVIIRTSIGSQRPLHPQHQHIGDFTEAFKKVLSTVEIIRLEEPSDIFTSYEKALKREEKKEGGERGRGGWVGGDEGMGGRVGVWGGVWARRQAGWQAGWQAG